MASNETLLPKSDSATSSSNLDFTNGNELNDKSGVQTVEDADSINFCRNLDLIPKSHTETSLPKSDSSTSSSNLDLTNGTKVNNKSEIQTVEESDSVNFCRNLDLIPKSDPHPNLNFINLTKLNEKLGTLEGCVQFCQDYGLIPKSCLCPSCSCPIIKLSIEKDRKSFKLKFICHKKLCRSGRYRVNAKEGTWFQDNKISIKKSLILIYSFIREFSFDQCVAESSTSESITSKETVADCYLYCREVCTETLLRKHYDKQIGGPNLTIEIEKARFGKRRRSKCRFLEGQIILGGLCLETNECFLVPLENESDENILSIIKKRVAAGSFITTDCCDCNQLIELGFSHLTVNPSQNLVHLDTRAIKTEQTWFAVRQPLLTRIRPTKNDFAGHLGEFFWRRRIPKQEQFWQMLKDIARLYPGTP